VLNKSHVLEPLNSLLKGNVQLKPQERAFKELKRLLESAPTLSFYDYTKKIILQARI